MAKSNIHDEPQLEELVTPDELEAKWGIPKTTQAAMRSRREIPFTMIGRRTPRYRRAELMSWLAARAVPARTRGA